MKHNRTSRAEKHEAKSPNAERQNAIDASLKEVDSVDGDSEAETSFESSLTKFTNQLSKLAPGISESSVEQAKKTIEQAMATFEKGKEAYSEARQTFSQLTATIEEVKASAKGALGKVRENPEPYFAAIAPGAMGVFLLVEKWRNWQRTR